jgi:hypothetical protein
MNPSGPGQDYSVALPDYFDWRNENTVFEHLAATHKESRNLSGIPGRDPERVSCASVTRNFFSVVDGHAGLELAPDENHRVMGTIHPRWIVTASHD